VRLFGRPHRTCITPCFRGCLALLFLVFEAARASPVSAILEDAAKSATKAAEETAITAAAAARSSAVRRAAEAAAASATSAGRLSRAGVATLDPNNKLLLTIYAAGAASIVVADEGVDSLIKFVDEIGQAVFVTPDALRSHSNMFQGLLDKRPGSVKVVADDGADLPVTISSRAGHQTLVVDAGSGLTYSVQAWEQRHLLTQRIMSDLVARLKIIALVPATDQVQRGAFRTALGRKVAFVENDKQLSAAMSAASKRFVIVVGHVEGEDFVLRGAQGDVLLQRRIDSLHASVEASQSVALMLGCSTACGAAVTGPIAAIDGLKLTGTLSTATSAETPYDFLRQVALQTGPMYVDTDIYGRLRAVSSAYASPGDKAINTASVPVRIFISSHLANSAPLIEIFGRVVILLPLLTGLGWLYFLLFGFSPRKGWRQVKETYASLLDRSEDKIDLLTSKETFVLFIFGPWLVFLTVCSTLTYWILNVALSVFAFVSYPVWWIFGHKILERAHCWSADSDKPTSISFVDGREAVLATGTIGVSLVLTWSSWCHLAVSLVPSITDIELVGSLVVTSFALAALLLRQFPFLIGFLYFVRMMPALLPHLLTRTIRRSFIAMSSFSDAMSSRIWVRLAPTKR
jgi:hypothetical protein